MADRLEHMRNTPIEPPDAHKLKRWWAAYGEIYAKDANATITISGTGVANKVQVTAFDTNGENSRMTPDHTNDHITVIEPGKYLCAVSISAISTGGTPYVAAFQVFVNNGATAHNNVFSERNLAGGGSDQGSISMNGIIDLSRGDTVELWTWNATNTNDIIVDNVTLSLHQVAGRYP